MCGKAAPFREVLKFSSAAPPPHSAEKLRLHGPRALLCLSILRLSLRMEEKKKKAPER